MVGREEAPESEVERQGETVSSVRVNTPMIGKDRVTYALMPVTGCRPSRGRGARAVPGPCEAGGVQVRWGGRWG